MPFSTIAVNASCNSLYSLPIKQRWSPGIRRSEDGILISILLKRRPNSSITFAAMIRALISFIILMSPKPTRSAAVRLFNREPPVPNDNEHGCADGVEMARWIVFNGLNHLSQARAARVHR